MRYGSKALELAKGKNAIVVNSEGKLPTVLKLFVEAVEAGEFDKLLDEQVSCGKQAVDKKVI
ncbi:hypothetical protein [Tropicimonas sp. IMCC34011]|uniref:hypothetical protein n=1 Tax=Tropicimonas sp. IMCC34011 TaxID=2248759 RepID=UPI001300AC4D|nr:hypothetical protein [Tropicimonas sp. IMCC34011]